MRQTTCVRFVVAALCFAFASSCGDDGGGTGGAEGTASNTTRPCAQEGQPALAAYNRKTGALKWAVCATDNVRRDVLQATDKAVYLATSERGTAKVTAYDTASGEELPDGGPANERPASTPRTGPYENPAVDGVRIEGGQDDATSAVDASTGKVLWSQPGSPPYDDVWAIGDGAVFVINRRGPTPPQLVAYELKSGATRWKLDGVDPYGAMGWPWFVEGKEVFTIWSNLAVISTRDGKTRWQTNYPRAEFPRMTGVRANATLVFVAFSSIASGGD